MEAQRRLDSVWLACYLRPQQIGFYSGGEFKAEFKELCEHMGLAHKPSGSWNPQYNSILESVHQDLSDYLQLFNLKNKDLD